MDKKARIEILQAAVKYIVWVKRLRIVSRCTCVIVDEWAQRVKAM